MAQARAPWVPLSPWSSGPIWADIFSAIQEAKDFMDLGVTLSVTAVLTFARDYDEVVRYVPLSSIITETDAPYIAPARIRGKRNEPTSVIDVVEAIAGIREEDPEMVREAVLSNAKGLFRLS